MDPTAFSRYNINGFVTARLSGYIAFNKDGPPMAISASPSNKFNLYSFVVSSGFRNQLRLTILDYRQSKILYSATYPLYTLWQQLIKLNYLDVEVVTLSAVGSSEFSMDNLCLSA
ncbi:unnamed protein product [Rotaria socialis]|uniref:Uncharacterized protein n=2 Tax=Rotaria socialis TaxID=392032 RepID=A0A821VLI1_9BILA|nr:unnamed protein product [Rotaria socialis]CAF3398880.1 unnamed protein product [Rotaria socialis]CAF3565008.1 unnamed protein product [Rotaria socialis]CAF3608937.1 unnamed protein product [Rotaria socialis]CAF4507900.1 unnamed protein product [Rotaria socialis]